MKKIPKLILFTSASLFLIGAVQSDDKCPDRAALDKVDAFTHSSAKSRGRLHKSVNINDLERVEMIDVVKANVPILCDGMVKMFPHLEYLSLISVNLTIIQPEAFQQVPKLKTLTFAVNQLTQIKRNQLKNLPNLQSLSFAANKISVIDLDAFNDLPKLERIFLDRNELYEISSEWFLMNSQMKLIDLSFNGISKLQNNAFTLLRPDSRVEIRLKNNRIEEIDSEAINYEAARNDDDDLPYVVLHLEKNQLKSIPLNWIRTNLDNYHSSLILNNNHIDCVPDEVLNHLKTSTTDLTIQNNPINCDCRDKIDQFMAYNEPRANFKYENYSFSCDMIQPSGFI